MGSKKPKNSWKDQLKAALEQGKPDTLMPNDKPDKEDGGCNNNWDCQAISQTPLQQLKIADLQDGVLKDDGKPYKRIFEYQEILLGLLDIQNLDERLEHIQQVIQASNNPSHRKTLQKILGIRNNPRQRNALLTEISKLDDLRIREVLSDSANADKGCESLYNNLCSRVQSLASDLEDEQSKQKIKAIVIAEFSGYVRVGGLPGFRERLLPVMHPVYGIPYVPSSSIKGALKAWARKTGQQDIDRLLGYLKGNEARLSAVEILDAFPMQPCLKVDVATPQWKWEGEDVKYSPAPHQLLSLENLKLQIGLCQTSRGSLDDVRRVMEWLEDALLTDGLGSRVSAGYGHARKANDRTFPRLTPAADRSISRHRFEFWSQGMYGSTPPSKENRYNGETEFRATAIRGILRYWFRAVALGLLPPIHCQTLEHILFGTLEPKARHGHVRISLSHLEEMPGDEKTLHHVSGSIVIETTTQNELKLLQYLLRLATHIGGVGRGSRRPLHINKDGKREDLRGCYWQLTDESMQIGSDAKQWKELLDNLRNTLEQVQQAAYQTLKPEEQRELDQFTTLGAGSPGTSGTGNRCQDVLNTNARIYLIKDSNLRHPSQKGWDAPRSRGVALDFLYNNGYKGVSKTGPSNAEVGGALETPSFVWITSNYPKNPQKSYQVITVFGATQNDRAKFCQTLKDKYKIPNFTEIAL